MRPATPTAAAGLAPSGSLGHESRRETVRWWATGLALVPLFVLITVFGYVLVASLGGVLVSPFVDLPDTSDDPFLAGTLGLAAFGLLLGGLPYLVVCAILLAILRRLATRGWDSRRLRRAAVVGGLAVTAPFVILAPIGVLFGLLVPLPGAGAETRRRALAIASAGAVGLFVLLVPMSLIVPHVG